MKLSLKLKPSLLGQYYEKQCDKSLVYYSVDKNKYKELGWVEPVSNTNSAATMAGNDWEKILYDRLVHDDTCQVINLKREDCEVTLQDTVASLKGLTEKEKEIYLYQACFGITPSFKEKYLSMFNDGNSDATFSTRMFPDFIKAEYMYSLKKYRLTIIDAKNASYLKIGAEIQISLYVRILKAILQDEGIDNCFVNEEEGIVWNREKVTDNKLEHIFRLKEADVELDAFFSEKLPEICQIIDQSRTGSKIQENLSYRVSQKCEYCDNFETCKNHCIDKENVRLMPYMTVAAQDRIDHLITDGKLKDDSLDSVKSLLESQPDLLTEDCSYWKNIKNNLEAYVKGLRSFFNGNMERFPKEGTSLSFPIYQDQALILTAQQDVNTGRVYAYSWLLKEGMEADSGYLIALKNTDEEFDRIDCLFVEKIHDILKKVSESEDPKKRRIQCFVMDDYERKNIDNTLFYMLEKVDSEKDQALLEKVISILFWLQGERLVTDSDMQPMEIIDTPITVLTSEISRLYVLSEEVAYNLKKTSAIFSPDFNFEKDNSEFFSKLSNVVEGTNIVNIWNEKKKDKKELKVNRLGNHLVRRLQVESSIIAAVQTDNRNDIIQLSKWPAQYQMQEPKYPDYPEIARLDFENKYELLLSFHQVRGTRMAGIENAIDNGAILWLEYTGNGNTYKVLNNENYIGSEWFCAWLCEDNPENRLQILLLRDMDYTGATGKQFQHKYEVRNTNTVFYPADNDKSYNYVDNGSQTTIQFSAKEKSGFQPEEGKRYLFFAVFSDVNSKKTAFGISKLVDRQELLDPKRMSAPTGIKYDESVEKVCTQYWSPDGFCFSPSQKKAFIHLMEQKLNVLVGPPAAGKTDFIARSLITISNYYKVTENKNMKIMVTAMSHSAIENVLLKLDKMLQKQNPFGIEVLKLSRFDDEQAFVGKAVSLKSEEEIAKQLSEDKIQIVGMTGWSSYKAFLKEKKGTMFYFDMVVMDEASQVRAMDAFLNLECSDEHTRFLLVGDDDQLPPIIGGKYKEVEGKKYIHGSIFRMYLTGLGKDHPDIIYLSDNFRMNGILCKYSAKKLYGETYQAFNDKIKTQKISLKKNPKDSLFASLLNPDYPLVFCELSGVSREQHNAEVQLVTQLVHELWENQQNTETNQLASKDGNFWRDLTKDGLSLEGACGIISPHHEHINRLKTSISDDLGIDREEVFIGTVDKLQGKERKTVIVSYGVSESEKIMNESEFIFSSNRFNVSLTRGKAKTIIFLSDAIAEPNIQTNLMTANDGNLSKGIDFIHGFSEFIKKAEEGEELSFEEFPQVVGDVGVKVWKKRMK